jgi:hypothetical protein
MSILNLTRSLTISPVIAGVPSKFEGLLGGGGVAAWVGAGVAVGAGLGAGVGVGVTGGGMLSLYI